MKNSFVTCPLDKNHRIMVNGLSKHLKKCLETRPTIEFVVCPFNSNHRMKVSRILEHCATCMKNQDKLNKTASTGVKVDPLVKCPFNNNHQIAISKLQNHLSKCMKNYSMDGFTTCPFNKHHSTKASRIANHCSICPDIKDVLARAVQNKNNSSKSTKNNSRAVTLKPRTFVVCPYDKNHIMKYDNFQHHVQKCKINHLTIADALHLWNNQLMYNRFQMMDNKSHPGMSNPLIQRKITDNDNELASKNISLTLNAARYSSSSTESNATIISIDNTEIVVRSQQEQEKESLRCSSSDKLETSEITSTEVSPVRAIKMIPIPNVDKSSFQAIPGTNNLKSPHTTISNTNMNDLNSCGMDLLKSSPNKTIGCEEFCQRLKMIKEKEAVLAEEMRVLRQKQEQINKEKEELAKIFKKMISFNDEND